MVNRVHVIDTDVRRRARVSRELNGLHIHTEIYEDIREFLSVAPTTGLILAADDHRSEEPYLADIMKELGCYLPIVGYAETPSTQDVVDAVLAGAAGFLQWPFEEGVLAALLNRFSEEGEQRLRRERMFSRAKERVARLSRRETEVLVALIGGQSNKEIGLKLGISPRTVEIHRSNMMSKLRARSVADAVKIGLYAGLDEELDSLPLHEAA